MNKPIRLPGDAATARGSLSDILRETIRKHREDVLSALRQMPAFLSAAEKLAANGNRYRVLVSKENLHLLREGANGITNPWLRDATGRFVENVDLVRVPADIAGSLTAVAVQAVLTELSVKLDVVVRGVKNLEELMRQVNRGALQGAVDALEVARRLRDDQARSTQMLTACGQIFTQIGKVVGQMKANIVQMPSPETDFWTGWNGDRLEEAEKTWTAVRQDFAVIGSGLGQVVSAYFELGEFEAARDAFSRVCARLGEADLQAAADRARLLPYPKGGPGPEQVFESFLVTVPLAEERLRGLSAGDVPELEFDFAPEEVKR